MYTSVHAGRTRTPQCTVTAASTSDLTLDMYQQLCWSDTKWFCTVATPLTSRVLELHAVHTAQVTVCSHVFITTPLTKCKHGSDCISSTVHAANNHCVISSSNQTLDAFLSIP